MPEDPISTPLPSPLPVPTPETGVLLFGGTFDPPHLAHTQLASAARDAAMQDAWLVFVPAAASPHKARGPIASPEDRAHMLRLATRDLSRSGVWTDEIDRAAHAPGPSYWVDTLERARSLLGPDVPLRFLIGADQACAFDRWHRYERILELAEPMVMLRGDEDSEDELITAMMAGGQWCKGDLGVWRGRVVELPLRDVSSTLVRAMLAEPEPNERLLLDLLDERVFGYALSARLYRTDERAAGLTSGDSG